MTSSEIRQRFLDFFAKRGHAVVPSASLVPKNDPSVLFNTAGMQQFKPYYTGDKDPHKEFGTNNVTSVQKCIRTNDIDEVGDDTHLTFFEMLGNFSFGGYWKKEAIEYAHAFITLELGLTIEYVSIFRDDASGISADEESRQIWQTIDPTLSIKEHAKEDNFWGPTGDEGPCGPTTEIYINGVEVWNIVFNEYYKTTEGVFEPLATKGIDTGMGLERLLVTAEKKESIFETDLFAPAMAIVEQESDAYNERSARIVADHIRTAVFLLADGVLPGNKDQGYVLRRLIRRAVLQADKLNLVRDTIQQVADMYIEQYKDIYPELLKENLLALLSQEKEKFKKTLEAGIKILEESFSVGEYAFGESSEKGGITADEAFNLSTTFGFPIELTIEEAKNRGKEVDLDGFLKLMSLHREKSSAGAEQKFKGGLANTSEMTTRLHTAHHLLLKALQEVVSPDIHQKGSNITEERLRLDFNFDRKLTDEEKQRVEDLVNEKIREDLTVTKREMPKAEAEKLGAEMEFGTNYPDIVSVYMIHDAVDNVFSQEFCGGPHVSHTGVLGHFKIQKEEASSAGIRRIKATLNEL